ncbi:hypothetical protein BLNAU_304 [Blattamonas nauphoetae]|uniref:Ubiquitin-like domain-containing protein n=1 Tax=Blattamonas nauphoetae TaxID=2049346 RepID=A0ABQ9YMM8_9EUKA|nr:hypothetical protein BLNAU_304 [Blattamonas nauphoetae]
MQLKVKVINQPGEHTVDCLDTDTIPELKEKLVSIIGLETDKQRIICSGRVLKEGTLHENNLQDGSTIHICPAMRSSDAPEGTAGNNQTGSSGPTSSTQATTGTENGQIRNMSMPIQIPGPNGGTMNGYLVSAMIDPSMATSSQDFQSIVNSIVTPLVNSISTSLTEGTHQNPPSQSNQSTNLPAQPVQAQRQTERRTHHSSHRAPNTRRGESSRQRESSPVFRRPIRHRHHHYSRPITRHNQYTSPNLPNEVRFRMLMHRIRRAISETKELIAFAKSDGHDWSSDDSSDSSSYYSSTSDSYSSESQDEQDEETEEEEDDLETIASIQAQYVITGHSQQTGSYSFSSSSLPSSATEAISNPPPQQSSQQAPPPPPPPPSTTNTATTNQQQSNTNQTQNQQMPFNGMQMLNQLFNGGGGTGQPVTFGFNLADMFGSMFGMNSGQNSNQNQQNQNNQQNQPPPEDDHRHDNYYI